jgi:hypothetical protein
VWPDLTPPQATIISSIITVVGALGAIVVGSWLFRGRVRDLKSALDHSEKLLSDHKASVEGTLIEVRSSLSGLDEQFRTTIESLGQIRGQVGDLESASPAQQGATEPQITAREKLKNDWTAIRDRLEMIAANPDLDGRTRAKYARIDRRQYGEFWHSLNADGRLGSGGKEFKRAIDLWQKYRSGRSTPTFDDLACMETLRANLLSNT